MIIPISYIIWFVKQKKNHGPPARASHDFRKESSGSGGGNRAPVANETTMSYM